MARMIDAASLKGWIRDGRELAILDAREDGEFGRSHLFWANPCGLSRMELRARAILPRIQNGQFLPIADPALQAGRINHPSHGGISLLVLPSAP
ncbi:MAG: hypothetical protein ACKOC9_12670 [Alphaproteobacteria bacterium]